MKMQYREFESLVLSRQACRNFTGEEIDREKLEKILTLARLTPSACNSQPWRIKVVTEKKERERVAEALQDEGANPYVSKASAFLCLYCAPAKLKKYVEEKYPEDHFVPYDIGALGAYITLAAETLGVASLIVGWINSEKLDRAVSYEGDGVCNLVIALGFAESGEVRRKIRKPMEEITF